MAKRFLAIVISVILLTALFTGCGDNTASDKEKTTASTTQSAPEESTQVQPAGSISVLTAWAIVDDVLKAFKEKTGIEVKQDLITNGETFKTTRNAKIASGEDMDIITADGTDALDFAKKGYMVDLSNEAWLKNFNPLMLQDIQNRVTVTPGKTYFVSYEGIFMGVWYNKDIFKKYNIEVPTCWDEFISVCDTLKKNGVAPLVQGGKDLWPLDQEMKFARERLMDDNKTFKKDLNTGVVKWTDKPVVDMFKRLEILKKDKGYYTAGLLGTTYDQCWQLMLQHKSAMWVMGSWAVETMTKSEVKPDFELGVFALPNNDKGGQQHCYGAFGARPYGVYSRSKNVEASKKFLEFLSQPENMSIQAAQTKVIPTVNGCTAETVPALADWMKVESFPVGGDVDQDVSAGSWGAEVQKIWWMELAKVAEGQQTIEQYCAALQKAQEKDNTAKK